MSPKLGFENYPLGIGEAIWVSVFWATTLFEKL